MGSNCTAQHRRGSLGRLVAAGALLLMGGSTAHAGPTAPTLSVIGGTGIPGGTVNVTVALSNDPNMRAFSTGMDLMFDPDILVFPHQFAPQGCTLDQRIATTHQIQGPLSPGSLDIEIFGANFQNSPLGNGNLASCAFRVMEGVPTGTTALVLGNAFLADSTGTHINPINIVNGEVVIAQPTPTFTITITPTRQATGTATTTRTVVATSTSTAARTATATNTVNGGGSPTTTTTATVTHTAGTATATTTHGTATVTATVSAVTSGTATATRTSGTPGTQTATVTRTPTIQVTTPTAQRNTEDDGCNIAPTARASSGGAWALLLAPAVLLWARRRKF